MTPTRALSVTTLLALFLQAAPAQTATLADLYHQALSNDPQLQAAVAAARAGAEALPQARAALLPNVTLSGNSRRVESSVNDFNDHGLTLTLSQPVYDRSRWESFTQGRNLSDQAALQLAQVEQTLILRTVEAYLNVLRALNALETSQAQERAIKRRLDQVNAQFEVGLIAITDVQEAQASYDNARVARIEAEGSLDNSFEALERLSNTTVTRVDLLHADYPIEDMTLSADAAWDSAIQHNLSLKLAQSVKEVARQASRINRAGHWPTLSLDAAYDTDEGTQLSPNGNQTSSIGLTLTLPLYQGGSTESRVRESEHRFSEAEQNYEDTLRAVRQSTRSLGRDLRTNVLSVAARAQSIRSSETALKATEEGFNVGTRNVVDVLNAEQALYAAQRDYANARFDYVLNLFRFKQQLGTLQPDDLAELDHWLIASH